MKKTIATVGLLVGYACCTSGVRGQYALEDLINGHNLTVQGVEFSNWQLNFVNHTDALGPDLSRIDVSPAFASDQVGVRISTDQLFSQRTDVLELEFAFDVAIEAPKLQSASLELTEYHSTGPTSSGLISTEFIGRGAESLGNLEMEIDSSESVEILFDQAALPGPKFMSVVTAIEIEGDDLADSLRIDEFVHWFSLSPSNSSDLTGNGHTDFDDLAVLLAHWDSPVNRASGNLIDERNTRVDFDDLTFLLAQWTQGGQMAQIAPEMKTQKIQSVPEPSTLLLAMLSLAGFLILAGFGIFNGRR